MARKLYPKKKVATLPFSDLVETGSPDLFYSVQQALQNEGVLLIDLSSGDIIEGQVNIPSVGMIAGNKPVNVKRQMGFVQPTLPGSVEVEKADIDAVLICKAWPCRFNLDFRPIVYYNSSLSTLKFHSIENKENKMLIQLKAFATNNVISLSLLFAVLAMALGGIIPWSYFGIFAAGWILGPIFSYSKNS